MVKSMKIAQKAAREAIESTYEGICTVIERQDIRDERTKITKKSEVIVTERQPCKLSFERLNTVVQTDAASALSQSTKLFVSPEIVINEGSKIIVEQDGRKSEYAASGAPAVYATHQEVLLELWKEWA